jgi:hypothetical protein
VAGGGLVLTAAALLTRTLRPTLEARRYVKEIQAATEGAVEQLHALSGLQTTRGLTGTLAATLDGPRQSGT